MRHKIILVLFIRIKYPILFTTSLQSPKNHMSRNRATSIISYPYSALFSEQDGDQFCCPQHSETPEI